MQGVPRTPSRRAFLARAAGACAVIMTTGRPAAANVKASSHAVPALPNGGGVVPPPAINRGTLMLDQVTLADFECHVGSIFAVESDADGSIPLELIAAKGLGQTYRLNTGAPAREAFSLLFQGPPGVTLSQGTHALTHPHLGVCTLFLVPVGIANADSQPLFEAIFT